MDTATLRPSLFQELGKAKPLWGVAAPAERSVGPPQPPPAPIITPALATPTSAGLPPAPVAETRPRVLSLGSAAPPIPVSRYQADGRLLPIGLTPLQPPTQPKGQPLPQANPTEEDLRQWELYLGSVLSELLGDSMDDTMEQSSVSSMLGPSEVDAAAELAADRAAVVEVARSRLRALEERLETQRGQELEAIAAAVELRRAQRH
eukprot:RCo028289